MQFKNLSIVLACAATISVFALYSAFKPVENTAYASNVVGAALEDVHGSERVSSLRALRRDISQSPENLLDIYGQDIYEVFRAPEIIRRDAPTTIWQYRNDSCVLDVYFTTQKKTAMAAPVVHYEVRMREDAEDVSERLERSCVKTLARVNAGFALVNYNAMYKAD